MSTLNLLGFLRYIIVEPDNEVFQGNFLFKSDLNNSYSK